MNRTACCLFPFVLAFAVQGATYPAYPVKVSANRRYLVDQRNQPFLMLGDAPHSLIGNISTEEAALYLHSRATNGFNTIWVELEDTDYLGMNPRPDWSMLDGTVPFTGTVPPYGSYDLTRPNEAYFKHVDDILRMAATNGLMVLLDTIETGAAMNTFLENGSNACFGFGQYLGNRYKDFTNILWITGNDQSYVDERVDCVMRAVPLGIMSVDSNHIHTVQWLFPVSMSMDQPSWWNIIQVNGIYSYYPVYAETLNGWNLTNYWPVYLQESVYEGEGGFGDPGNANAIRRSAYPSLLYGGLGGFIYGDGLIWRFSTGWQAELNSPGTKSTMLFGRLFASLARWHDLVPDQTHSLVSSGYGTYVTDGTLTDSDFLTAASTSDGRLAVAYVPTSRTFTVEMTNFVGQTRARWYDPTSGAFIGIGSFANTAAQHYIPPGQNSDGDEDWVLVLESVPPGDTQPPAIVVTAPANGAIVSNLVAVSALVTDNGLAARVQFQVDGVDLGQPLYAEPYTNSWDTLGATNGPHILQVIAQDISLNYATQSVFMVVNNPANSARTDSLVAAFSFNEGSATVALDSSGNGNAGALDGQTWTGAGKYGSALVFGGSGWVTVNDSPSLDLTNGMSLEAWIEPSAFSGESTTLLVKETPDNLAYMLQTDPANYPTVHIQTAAGSEGIAGPWPLPLNTWTHVASTYDGTVLRLFVDGIEVASEAVSGTIVTSAEPLRIGGSSVWGEYFDGTMDEVRIHNRALAQDELVASMNTPIANLAPRPEPCTIRRWPTTGAKLSVAALLSNVTDPNGDPITFVSASATSINGGTVLRQGDWLAYEPAAGFTNADAFTYTIADSYGATAVGTVLVNVRLDHFPPPTLTLVDLGGGAFRIQYEGVPAAIYGIEYSESLTNLVWLPLGATNSDSFGVFQYVDIPTNAPAQRFYRLVWRP